MKKLLTIYVVLSFSMSNLYSQNKTIKGRVISEDLDTMPYTLIVINDTIEVGKSDLNGFFQIAIPVSVKKILFMDVGMEASSIELSDTYDEIEVIMLYRPTYDFITLKKVDRLRMKRFRKLPELHMEAFKKGIFKTEKAFYTQKFIPDYKRKRKSSDN